MGMPEFDEGGGDNARRARDLAVKEALRKINSGTAGLVQGCCDEVLEQLKAKLIGITGESITDAEASSVPARWRAQKDRFEAACREGVELWSRYWAAKVRHVLEACDGVVAEGEEGAFVLGRFPKFISAIVYSVEQGVWQQAETLVQELKELGNRYYGKMCAWVKITTKLGRQGAAGGPTMTLACDHMALVESVMYCFVEQSTCGTLDDLKSNLVHISSSIHDDADWIEACADERRQLRVRTNILRGAKAQILAALCVESEEALLAHPAVKAVAAAPRASRILGGNCQHITHSALSGTCRGIAVSKEGHLYVADVGNKCVHVFSGEGPNGTHIKTLCAGQLSNPYAITVDDKGQLYVSDYSNSVVILFDKEGKHIRDIGSGQLSGPYDAAVDAQGHVYVANYALHVVSIFDQQGQFVRDIGTRGSAGTAPGQLHRPTGVAFDGDGTVYVCSLSANTVCVFDKHGTFIRSIGQGHLQSPYSVASCPAGRVYVASYSTNNVVVFDKTGAHIKSIPSTTPWYVCVDGNGQVCISGYNSNRISVLRAEG
jgi:DNA-binding beta-propeller fold protein YncE